MAARQVDAVLIGAGINALAAALHLSTKGWRVAVFERAPEVGGAVKTGEYTAPGFHHDWAAMNLSLFAGSPFFKLHGAELQRHGCAFTPIERPFASSFPAGPGPAYPRTRARLGPRWQPCRKKTLRSGMS